MKARIYSTRDQQEIGLALHYLGMAHRLTATYPRAHAAIGRARKSAEGAQRNALANGEPRKVTVQGAMRKAVGRSCY